jgi:cytochrome bd ubiquinol oxidase subunit II
MWPRARRLGMVAAVATTVLFAAAGVWLAALNGYRITSEVNTTGPSNPLFKTAALQAGAWFANYQARPVLWAVPAIGLLMPLLAALGLWLRREWLALLSSGLGIAGIIASVGASMFPFILPSSLNPQHSLTVWDSSSSHVTLFIMLVCALIFVPLIVAYTSWVYSVLRGKVDPMAIIEGRGHSY